MTYIDIIMTLLLYLWIFIPILLIKSYFDKKRYENYDAQSNEIENTIINTLLKFKESNINIIKKDNKNISFTFSINSEAPENNKKIIALMNDWINIVNKDLDKNIVESINLKVIDKWNIIEWDIKVKFWHEDSFETLLKNKNW